MILIELLDSLNKEKRIKAKQIERVKATQKFAVGMGLAATAGMATGLLLAPKSGKQTREDLKENAVNTVDTIKDTVQKKAEMVKDSAAQAEQEAANIIKDIYGKTEGVKKDLKDGYHEINQDIHKTAESISKELNLSVK